MQPAESKSSKNGEILLRIELEKLREAHVREKRLSQLRLVEMEEQLSVEMQRSKQLRDQLGHQESNQPGSETLRLDHPVVKAELDPIDSKVSKLHYQ